MGGFRYSLRGVFIVLTLVVLAVSHWWTSIRLFHAENEVRRLRAEVGFISEPDTSKLAAIRVPSDQPLTWKVRVRTPSLQPYQIAFGTLWPGGATAPEWHSSVVLDEGESLITLRLMEDPRDERWKIVAIVTQDGTVRRASAPLDDRQTAVFRGSHNTIRGGIQSEVALPAGQGVRVIEDKWFTGEGGLLLFGESMPDDDIDGVFAELMPLPGAMFQQPRTPAL